MNDIELVELIHSKPPEDLSLEEIEQLRSGLASSENLRREVTDRLEMEQYLQQALARVDLSVDDLLARAERRVAGPTAGGVMLLALCGVVGIAVGLLIVLAFALPRKSEPVILAHQLAANRGKQATTDRVRSTLDDEAVSPSPSDVLLAQPATENLPGDLTTGGEANSAEAATTQVAQGRAGEPIAADSVGTPWEEALPALQREPAPASALFRKVPPDQAPPSPELLQRWFSPVPGQRGDFGVRDYGGLRLGSIEGLVRLQAPLKPGLALRFALVDYGALRIHAWSGNRGVVLDHHENLGNKPWAGYVTTRADNTPLATRLSLAADDDDRFWRTNPQPMGVLELRYEDGALSLARGDIRLLDVPLPAAPTEVYFEGNQLYRHIELVRAAPLARRASTLLVGAEQAPAELTWQENVAAGGRLVRHDNGSIELQSENNAQPVWATFALDRPGLHEVEFEIARATPGAGLIFCDAAGTRVRQLSFVRDPQLDMLQLTNQFGVGDARLELPRDAKQEPVAYVAPPCWVKVLAAPSWFRAWVSVDRVHWARVDMGHVHQVQGIVAVGLQNVQQSGAAAIKLRHVTLRSLNLLNELVPLATLTAAPVLSEANDFDSFSQAANASLPPETAADVWLRACALKRLAHGANDTLTESLIDLLWQASLRFNMAAPQRMKLIDQLCKIAPAYDANKAKHALERYAVLGRTVTDFDQPKAFDQIATAQMMAPLWTRTTCEFLPVDLARRRVLDLALARDWLALAEYCQRMEFFDLPKRMNQEPLFAWATALAAQSDERNGDGTTAAMPANWRHPLLVDLSKEAFNVLADLRVALASGAYREACQVISSANVSGMGGLLPDANDPDLSLSLAGAVALAMREHPQLRETMQLEFGTVAQLRVASATVDGNEAEVEATTVQFYGTEAAAQAHVWLADRALSAGAFAAAMGHYRAARESAAVELLGRINAGEQLAVTLLGRDVVVKPGEIFQVDDRRLSSSEWQKLLANLRKQRIDTRLQAEPAARAVVTKVPPARQYVANNRGRLEGEAGQQPEQVPHEYQAAGADWPAFSLDWVARQVSVLPLTDRMLVSNRFQLASYDVVNGQLQWRAGLGGDQATTHSWRLVPARPVATAKLAYVRRFKAAGPVLVAVDLATGQVIWETSLSGEHWIVSDPVVTQGSLYAISTRHAEWGYSMSLLTIDLQTGVVLRERPLVSFRESWWQLGDCQVLAADERLFVVSGGAVIRCDIMGNVLWVRRQLLMPQAVDAFWYQQAQLPPLLHDGKLLVVQPGVPGVAALDATNGQRLWQAKLPTPRRVLGVVENRLLVDTSHGACGFDVANGNRLWQYASDNLLDGYLLAEKGGAILAERLPVPDKPEGLVRLIWLDTATGSVQHQVELNQPPHEQIYFGPTWFAGNRWWALSGQGVQDPNRNLVELTPK